MIRKGYILSKHTHVKHANSKHKGACVEVWVSTDDGPVCLQSAMQKPSCFVATENTKNILEKAKREGIEVEVSSDSFFTLEQVEVDTLKTTSDSYMHQLRQLAKSLHITLYEADIRLADRYLMERFIYGSLEFVADDENATLIPDARIRPAIYTPNLYSISIDIECDENENLFSIALASSDVNEVMLVSASTHPKTLDVPDTFSLSLFSTESALLTAFAKRIRDIDPDVILGWNVKQFDMAVLARRAKKQGVKFTIGREKREAFVRDWDGQTIVDIPGRSIVDGIEALKTMTYQFDSFSLDNVAQQLLGDKKLIQSEDKLAAIKALYYEDPSSLASYNHKDCVLVNEIAAKTRFIEFLILRGTLTGLDLGRPGGSVAAFLNVYLPKLHRQGYISGVRPEHGGLASPGGYVMNSQPGLYSDVLVLDFKSLYPSIIRTFKIDPMGLAEGLKDPSSAIEGFKGAMFSRDNHFLPDIIDNLWRQRDEAKKQNDAPRSQAIKILMNSFYGVLGSGGCPFYDPRLASSITLRGHEIMQTTAKWIEEAGFSVIYGDTDSTFVHVNNNTSLGTPNETGQSLANTINHKWQRKLREDYDIDCHLDIEFETHFETFFMPTIRGSALGSKKRYAGLKQTGDKKELVFKGLENVRSDWTELAKYFQYELYRRVFEKAPVSDFIKQTVDNIRHGKEDARLVYAKRLRKPLSDYIKSLPPHVKAARLADDINRKTGQRLRYQHNTTIRYVMTVQGPQTTEHQMAPLDYDHYIEKQIMPIADSILPLINLSFSELTNEQLSLFPN